MLKHQINFNEFLDSIGTALNLLFFLFIPNWVSIIKFEPLNRKQNIAIVCVCWFFHVVAYIVITTLINYMLIGNCSFHLWILVFIVLSTIHGSVNIFYQMNHDWVMQNVRGSTIHLIKIWYWILTHLVVFSLCTVWHLYWVCEFYQ